MTGQWPYPGDSPLVRARKIAQCYRAHLHAANPDICAAVDDMAKAFGETWVTPRIVTAQDDDELSAGEAADYLCTTTANVRRLRLAGRLAGGKRDGQWWYLVKDLRALQVSARRRRVVDEAGA